MPKPFKARSSRKAVKRAVEIYSSGEVTRDEAAAIAGCAGSSISSRLTRERQRLGEPRIVHWTPELVSGLDFRW
jgi:hypothetical protein